MDPTRGRGVAFARYKNRSAYCAVIAEVEVGEILRVKRVIAAVDAGQVVNPDGLMNQIEGGIVQAISWTLKEKVLWDRDRVLSRSWESYPILRFDETPEVEVLVLSRPAEPGLGVGECAAGPTAAAVANALYNAMGVRVRDLPLTPDRIAHEMDLSCVISMSARHRGVRMAGKSKLDEATKRRVRAGRLLLAGKTPPEVARAVGAPRQTVYRWRDVLNADGIDALRDMSKGGRPARLGAAELSRLYVALLEGPEMHGFTTPVWTLKRVRLWIEREFGVRYSEVHVWRLLGQLGFSNQKPERRALERDAAAIEEWRKRTWPALKKTPDARDD